MLRPSSSQMWVEEMGSTPNPGHKLSQVWSYMPSPIHWFNSLQYSELGDSELRMEEPQYGKNLGL